MTGVLAPPVTSGREALEPGAPDEPPSGRSGRRRFAITAVVALALVSVPYLWVLWNLWGGGWNVLRTVPPANFYELQARAIFAGHLYLPQGSMGIEAFNHDGHQYTYFGLFPALIRMPVLALTHRFDGKLTAPSLLASWLVTGLFASLLLWRARVVLRGSAVLGWAETISYGALVATIAGGSVLVELAATPFVYNEDFAWSVALTTASLFTLLGVLERPSTRRIVWCGVAILLTNLDRQTTGYACVIGALLVAGWFFLGRGPEGSRRKAPLVLLAGAIPLAVNCTVTYLKFGLPFGLPMADQVWTQINAHRRYFLKTNGGKAFSVRFIPSTALAYLQPFGIHVSSVFPFVTLPTTPARAVGGVVLDQTYQVASAPASMTLLFLLTVWGMVATFFRRPVSAVHGIWLVMLAAGSAAVGVLVWGYTADRYLGDLMPLLILGSILGLVDLWHRTHRRPRLVRTAGLGAVLLLAVWGIFANVAIAASPTAQWTIPQTKRFVLAQRSVSPGALEATVEHGSSLPAQSPAGHLFIAGNCSGLYLASGYDYSTSPGQQVENATWLPVEQSAGINHTVELTDNGPLGAPLTVLTFSAASLVLVPVNPTHAMLSVVNGGDPAITWPTNNGPTFRLVPGDHYLVHVMTDPNLHAVLVTWYGQKIIGRYLAGTGPAVVQATVVSPGAPTPAVTVTNITPPGPSMRLCRSLLRDLPAR